MYISKFIVKNYRTFGDFRIKLKPQTANSSLNAMLTTRCFSVHGLNTSIGDKKSYLFLGLLLSFRLVFLALFL